MWKKFWNWCVNYETISYLICGVLTTAVDFLAYTMLRRQVIVELAQAGSWVAAVLFAYVVNKLIVFRNYNFRPAYLAKEAGAFAAARLVSGAATWILMVGMVRLGGERGMLYELFCKAVTSAANLILNYVFSKIWIFKKETKE